MESDSDCFFKFELILICEIWQLIFELNTKIPMALDYAHAGFGML